MGKRGERQRFAVRDAALRQLATEKIIRVQIARKSSGAPRRLLRCTMRGAADGYAALVMAPPARLSTTTGVSK